jgi:hypothetical protein
MKRVKRQGAEAISRLSVPFLLFIVSIDKNHYGFHTMRAGILMVACPSTCSVRAFKLICGEASAKCIISAGPGCQSV